MSSEQQDKSKKKKKRKHSENGAGLDGVQEASVALTANDQPPEEGLGGVAQAHDAAEKQHRKKKSKKSKDGADTTMSQEAAQATTVEEPSRPGTEGLHSQPVIPAPALSTADATNDQGNVASENEKKKKKKKKSKDAKHQDTDIPVDAPFEDEPLAVTAAAAEVEEPAASPSKKKKRKRKHTNDGPASSQAVSDAPLDGTTPTAEDSTGKKNKKRKKNKDKAGASSQVEVPADQPTEGDSQGDQHLIGDEISPNGISPTADVSRDARHSSEDIDPTLRAIAETATPQDSASIAVPIAEPVAPTTLTVQQPPASSDSSDDESDADEETTLPVASTSTAAQTTSSIPRSTQPLGRIPSPPRPAPAVRQRPAVQRTQSAPRARNNAAVGTISRENLDPSQNTPENNEMLASKWMTGKDLAEAVIRNGLYYKSGKFSAEEDAVLTSALEAYRERHNITDEYLTEIILSKERENRGLAADLWPFLTRYLVDRPMGSVYAHVKRMREPTNHSGPFTQAEDAALANAVAQYGSKWVAVSKLVGRPAGSCRDRWRNHLEPGTAKKKGPWTKEEEAKLRKIMSEMKDFIAQRNHDTASDDIYWTAIAKKFGPTRSRSQIRIKWQDNLSNKIFTEAGERVRWSKRDRFILIMKLHSLDTNSEEDILWSQLPDEDWNYWSGHLLHKRYNSIKARALKQLGVPNAPFRTVVDYMKQEMDNIPRDDVSHFMSQSPGKVTVGGRESGSENGDETDDDDEFADTLTVRASGSAPREARNGADKINEKVRSKEFITSSDEEDAGDIPVPQADENGDDSSSEESE